MPMPLILASAILSAQARPDQARIVVDAAHVEGQIDARLYGQFVEFMFEGVKGGLAAELLRDRGFEEAANSIGLSRHWERYPDDRNDDYGLSFHWDDAVAYPVLLDFFEERPVPHALRVDVRGGVVERHGVYQPRIPVRAGVAYPGYLWLKTTGYEGDIRVALEEDTSAGRTHAEAEIRDIQGDWKQYPFVLRPTRADPHARLAILFEGRGRVWVDQVSLVPGDAAGGVRADVEARVAALRPAFIRWPGGNVAQDYHWMWGVGPRDRRPVWTNLSWKNEPEPGDIGTDEFIAFSRRVGAEPSITVNVEGRGATAEEAAAWVEYCNGPATSRYGAMRAANGHPRPYNVKYWELGNEIWGDWVRGHSDAQTYARNYVRYQRAMRAVDPGIQLIAVGDNDMSWNRTVLRIAGGFIDYLAIHHYYGREAMAGDTRNLMARPLHYERFYRDVERAIEEEAPGRKVRLNINEWGLDLPESRQYSMEAALYGARLMHVFERTSPLVAMSAESDLVNGWPGGIIQASRHGVFVSPLYYVNLLYNEHRGRDRLRATVEGPAFDTSREGTGVPVLDAVASRSADGSKLYVKVINTAPASTVTTQIDLRGVDVVPEADWHVITAEGPEARNSFATPDAISPRREVVQAGRSFQVSLPPDSVSVIVLRLVRPSAKPPPRGNARATFAGGCFWCMEPAFDRIPGVVSTTSGYAGGTVVNPTYEQVAAGVTGHAEVVQVAFDPAKVSYEQLLEVFWRNIDPLDRGGQFCDRGSQYRTAIYYEGDDQMRAALASRASLEKSGRLPGPIVTEIAPLKVFYRAEEHHQDYAIKSFRAYWAYRAGCGRGRRLRELWGRSDH